MDLTSSELNALAIELCQYVDSLSPKAPGVDSLVSSILDIPQSNQDWPADATHALVVRYSTWPVGTQEGTVYLPSLMQVRKHLRAWREFSLYEDNYVFEMTLLRWDWGPQEVGRFA